MYALDNIALGLQTLLPLQLPDVDVLPSVDTHEAQRHERHACNCHQPHAMLISADDGITLGRANRKGHLSHEVGEDQRSLVLGTLRQATKQLAGGNVVPDGTSNRTSNGSTESTKQSGQGVDGSKLLMGHRHHDGDAGASGKDSGAKANKHLRHCNQAGVVSRSHGEDQGGTQQHDWYTGIRSPLEVSSVADDNGDDRSEDGRRKGVGVDDVVGHCDVQKIYNLDVRVEVRIPSEGGKVHNAVEEARTQDSPVGKVAILEELLGSDLEFVEPEDRVQQDTGGDHGADVGRLPSVGRVLDQGEGNGGQDDRTTEKDDANNVDLDGIVEDRLVPVPSRWLALRHEACLICLAIHEDHHTHSWDTAANKNDCKGTKGPPIVDILVEALPYDRTQEGTGDTGQAIEGEEDRSVLERAHV